MEIKLSYLNIQNTNISVYKEINKYYDNILCITQYERNKETKEILHLGIKLLNVDKPENYKVFIQNGCLKHLFYDKSTSYFYYKTSEDNEDEIGISKAGFFYVKVYDLNNNIVYKSNEILVKPSVISFEMYKDMVNMLLNINKDLVLESNSDIYLNGKQINLSDKVLNFLNSIESSLFNINNNSNVELIKENSKVKYNKIKKFSRKIIIEKELYPFKDKFTSEITIESENTYENRMIYLALKDVQNFIQLKYENNKFFMKKYKKEFIETDNLIKETDNEEYKNKLIFKKDKLEKKINSLKMEEGKWEEVNLLINRYLNIDIFKQFKQVNLKKETWKATQVFLHDISYGRLYRKFKNFYEDINYNLSDLNEQQLNVKAVYNIFEVWIFFYMIKILTKEQGWFVIGNKDLIRNINNYINNNGSLFGFEVHLNHNLANSNNVKLKIIYNKTLNLENENLRPDFTFLFNINGQEKIFYLDAKYHNYLEDVKLFLKDLKNVACDKYYNKLIKTDYEASASFIVHCIDKNGFRFFGGMKKNNHRVGGFSLTNLNSNNFITWINLIMEWFYNEYNICWSCGNINVQCEKNITKGEKIKYYYNCDCCGSFWVKSHCYSCDCDKIIKHDLPEKQYHQLTSEKWMVKCPKCEESGVRKVISNTIYRSAEKSKKCIKCNGKGYISCYSHIESGRCFNCNGTGEI